MVDVTLGIKVLICPSEEQKDLFNKNFSCSRKVYNELLGKYNELYQKDNTLKPTYPFLSKLLTEIKNELPYLGDVESTSLQQSAKDLATSFSNFFKNPKHFNRPRFHSKRKTRPSFRQTIPANKKIIKDNILTLRVYGDVEFKTSPECGITLDRDVNAALNILNLWFTGDTLRNTNK